MINNSGFQGRRRRHRCRQFNLSRIVPPPCRRHDRVVTSHRDRTLLTLLADLALAIPKEIWDRTLSTVLADGGIVIIGVDHSVQLVDVPRYGLDERFARIIPRKGEREEHLVHVCVGISQTGPLMRVLVKAGERQNIRVSHVGASLIGWLTCCPSSRAMMMMSFCAILEGTCFFLNGEGGCNEAPSNPLAASLLLRTMIGRECRAAMCFELLGAQQIISCEMQRRNGGEQCDQGQK